MPLAVLSRFLMIWLPTSLAMLLILWVRSDDPLSYGLLPSLITGFGIALVVVLLERRAFEGRERSPLRPAAVERTALDPEEAREVILRTLHQTGFSTHLLRHRRDGISFIVGPGVRSFGERVEVSISSDDDGTVVRLTSRPLLPFTIADYGKNAENIEELSKRLMKPGRLAPRESV